MSNLPLWFIVRVRAPPKYDEAGHVNGRRFGSSSSGAVTVQSRQLSTFRPLTPGGSIYIALMLLVPLTIGVSGGSGVSGSGGGGGGDAIAAVFGRSDDGSMSLRNEMGYVDGNRIAGRLVRNLFSVFRRRTDRRNKTRLKKAHRY